MRQTKNQFAKAEIKLDTKTYLKGLNLTDSLLAKDLFNQIRNQNPSIAKHKWLVFYFDDDLKLRNWHVFKNCNPQTLKRVISLAIVYAVEKIMVVHQYTTRHAQASFNDYKCSAALFYACEAKHVELLDFLIHSPQLHFSFKDEGYN